MEENIQRTIIDELCKNDEFVEIRQFDKKDLRKIYEMFTKQRKYIDVPKKIDLYRCIYEVIKNNLKYHSIIPKIEYLYENSLENFLNTIHYTNNTGFEMSRGSYDLLRDQSFVLSGIISRQLKASVDQIIFMGNPELYNKVSARVGKFKRIQKELGYTYQPDFIENIELILDDSEKINKISDENVKETKQLELYTTYKDTEFLYSKLSDMQAQVSNVNVEMASDIYGIATSNQEKYSEFLKAKEAILEERKSKKEPTTIQEKNQILKEKVDFYELKLPAYKEIAILVDKEQEKAKQQQELENEQERIYNLIYSERNEQLNASHSLYTAWDLGDKVIPQKYQGMSYEQVENMINQEKAQQKAEQEAKATREDLINKAIRKDLGVAEDYHLSDTQISNLRVNFDWYSDEELKDFIAGEKKETQVQQSVSDEPRKLEPIDLSSLLDENTNRINRSHMINEILECMYPNGADYVPLPDIKRQLESKSTEELHAILNEFSNEMENVPSNKTL